MGRRLPEGGQPPRQLVRVNLRKDWLAAVVGLRVGVLPLLRNWKTRMQPPKVEDWVRRLPGDGNRTTGPLSVCRLRERFDPLTI